MNIRRNVLIVICILSASMILSSCDKGGNHTESELGGSNMSDVNDVVVNEEDKPVEPRDIYWINRELVNETGFKDDFTLNPSNGNSLNIAVKSNSKAKVRLIVYRSGKEIDNVLIDGNKGTTLSYKINTSTTFKVELETGGEGPFSVSIRARQFKG